MYIIIIIILGRGNLPCSALGYHVPVFLWSPVSRALCTNKWYGAGAIMFQHLLTSTNSPQGTSFSAAISPELDIESEGDIIKDTNQTGPARPRYNWVVTEQ